MRSGALIARGGGTRVLPALLDYMAQRRAQEKRWTHPLARTELPIRLVNGLEDPVLWPACGRSLPSADDLT